MEQNDGTSISRVYGDTHISGQARVQLGDQINHFNIRDVYLQMQDELQLPRLKLQRAKPRKRRAQDSRDTASQRPVTGRSTRSVTKSFTRLGSYGDVNAQDSTLREKEQTHETWQRDADAEARCLLESTSSCGCHKGGAVSDPKQWAAQGSQELFALLAVVVSFFVGRHATKDDIVSFLLKCQKDQLLPIMTFFLGIGIYRYAVSRNLPLQPCSHTLLLEDAYGRTRQLSLDVCVDFGLMKRFLQVHYSDTDGITGLALVGLDQFHINVGSRRGRALDASNWQPNVFKNVGKVVNSVFMDSGSKMCTLCNESLSISALNGEFYCTICNRFYRGYNATPSFTAINQTQTRLSRDLLTNKPILPKMDETDSPPTAYFEWVINGMKELQHVDLRVTAPTWLCVVCSGIGTEQSLMKCDLCTNSYHLWCLQPPTPERPSRIHGWICSDCVRAQEAKLGTTYTTLSDSSTADSKQADKSTGQPQDRGQLDPQMQRMHQTLTMQYFKQAMSVEAGKYGGNPDKISTTVKIQLMQSAERAALRQLLNVWQAQLKQRELSLNFQAQDIAVNDHE